jgi:hypothetical protein
MTTWVKIPSLTSPPTSNRGSEAAGICSKLGETEEREGRCILPEAHWVGEGRVSKWIRVQNFDCCSLLESVIHLLAVSGDEMVVAMGLEGRGTGELSNGYKASNPQDENVVELVAQHCEYT